MNKYLIVIMLISLFSCTTQKFHAGDKVEVIDGFFKGCVGIVTGNDFRHYDVSFMICKDVEYTGSISIRQEKLKGE